MKRVSLSARLLFALLAVAVASPCTARAQVAFYADFSVTRLTDLTATRTLYGPTIGGAIDLAHGPWVALSADVRGSFVGGSNGVRLNGVVVGPRLSTHIRKFKPYGEFLIGLARYDNGLNQPGSSTTDTQVELNAGVDYPLSKRLDWRVIDYSWGKYLALGGEFNPREYSTGIVLHIP